MSGFAELGAMSNFTFLEGASHPSELVTAAKVLGHAAIGIADRNSFAGLVRGMAASWLDPEVKGDREIRFVPGCRVALEDGAEYLVWPTDAAAYARLSAMLSAARMPADDGRPARDALIAAAEGQVMAAIPPDEPDESFAHRLRRDAEAMRRRLALPLFLAAHHRFAGDDRRRLRLLSGMAGSARAPLLAAGGARMHVASRRRLADVLAAIRLGTTVDALGLHAQPNAEAHLKPEAEMRRLFEGFGEAVDATLRVVAACRFDLKRDLTYEYPEEIVEPGLTAQETLERRVAEAVRVRWPDGASPKVAAQIAEEMALIARLGYAPYFLTVHEIVRFADSKGILCQGRGSAANSAVCYALGITSVNPDHHRLLFARFLSDARGEPPDIDIDFEHERREEVIQHIYERYGRDRAAITATLIRYRTRSAVREVGKVMGLSEDITGRLAKASWHDGMDGLRDVAREAGLNPKADPRLGMALDLAEELHGFPRHLATHVGGFVIARGKLTELAIVRKAAMEDRHTVEWDKDDIAVLEMLKVDVLGLGMLSCLKRAFDLLEGCTGERLQLYTVPQDDPATYAMLSRGDSIGVFQVESRAQMNMLPRMRPRQYYDLVIEVAIVRPGPIQGDMVHPYLRRRAGIEKPEYAKPELKAVLEKTLGVPLFQEQAMEMAIVAAGFTPSRADELRRSMASFKHDGKLDTFREEFEGGMIARGYEPDFAHRCFEQIRGFGGYGFPESHAASFAQLVYVSAWIKCHHPAVFAAALLNSQPMGFYAPAQIVRDAREHGVAVRPPDVTVSEWDCTLEREGEGWALRLGLRLVSGLSKEDANKAIALRGRATPAALAAAGLHRPALEALAQADAFRGLGLDRRRALWEAAAVERAASARDMAPLPLFAAAEAAPRLPAETSGEETVLDIGATGLTLRAHPLALLRPALEELRLRDSRAVAAARQGQSIRFAGLVLVRQRPGSAKGVVFFTLEDEFGTVNLVLQKDTIAAHRAAVVAARLLLVEGRIERHEEAAVPIVHILGRRLEDRSDLLDGLHRLGAARMPMARADEVTRGIDHRPNPRNPAFPSSRDWR
ncbi:error-prone DNA polymerase [Roseomonas populi]|uniref:Error-prone DNA polymerase n=1 Tax=Roseomonas populi TaxID=3121582 RepID=A0ABT1X152_9PROT|nr:error-prone DNA polymerase [Roseomonas pecuniae]MCR0981833.1 error-prone DNA polymerase [Roseomonas pecuniae]